MLLFPEWPSLKLSKETRNKTTHMLHWLTIMLLHSVSISYFRRSVILLWCHRLKSNYTCIRQHRITPLTLMYRVTIKFKVTQSETVYMPSFYICCDGHKKSAQIPPLLSTIISLFYSPRFSLALITLTKSWDKKNCKENIHSMNS